MFRSIEIYRINFRIPPLLIINVSSHLLLHTVYHSQWRDSNFHVLIPWSSLYEQGVTIESLSPGDGVTFPKKGGMCAYAHTGIIHLLRSLP